MYINYIFRLGQLITMAGLDQSSMPFGKPSSGANDTSILATSFLSQSRLAATSGKIDIENPPENVLSSGEVTNA